jgi:OmpA-OmpF porin, OOP family
LGPKAMKLLKIIMPVFQENLNREISIEGHADSIGSKNYNYQLSRKRASSVGRYLCSLDAALQPMTYIIGYGESRPVAINDTELGRSKNRRVDIIIKRN